MSETTAPAKDKDVNRFVAGHELPSTFVDHFQITFRPLWSRIAFGEMVGADELIDARYFEAFTMPTDQLVRMAQSILNAAAQMTKQNQPPIKAPTGSELAKFSRRPN